MHGSKLSCFLEIFPWLSYVTVLQEFYSNKANNNTEFWTLGKDYKIENKRNLGIC